MLITVCCIVVNVCTWDQLRVHVPSSLLLGYSFTWAGVWAVAVLLGTATLFFCSTVIGLEGTHPFMLWTVLRQSSLCPGGHAPASFLFGQYRRSHTRDT